MLLPGEVADVGEAFRRGDDERGRFGGGERWPERFLLKPGPVPKRSALIDIGSSELESSRGRSVFSARRLSDAPRLKSDRTFNVIVHCPHSSGYVDDVFSSVSAPVLACPDEVRCQVGVSARQRGVFPLL